MNGSSAILDCARRIRTRGNIVKALEDLTEIGHAIGLPRVSFIDDVNRDDPLCDAKGRPLVEGALGWPIAMTGWWFAGRFGPRTPEARMSASQAFPFVSPTFDSDRRTLSPFVLRLRTFMERFDISSSLIVPVHLPGGKTSLVSWLSNERGAAARVPPDEGVALQAAAYAFMPGVAHDQAATTGVAAPTLSTRQRECVHWAAGGKTEKEIAIILNVSPHTVHEHLQIAARKLDAHGRGQLIARAYALGMMQDS